MGEFDKSQNPIVSSRNNEAKNYGAAVFILQVICGVFFAFVMLEHVIDPASWLYLQYFPYTPF